MKFYDMSHFVRSKGKKTGPRAHCAVEATISTITSTTSSFPVKIEMEMKATNAPAHRMAATALPYSTGAENLAPSTATN